MVFAVLLLALCGLAVGATSIGGVLVVPVLTTVAQVTPERAVAAASFAFMFTGAAAFVKTGTARQVHPSLNLAALAGGALGALSLAWLPMAAVQTAVGVLAIASGVLAWTGRGRSHPVPLPVPALAALGLAVGCVSAWSGTGGPVALLPLLALLGCTPGWAVEAAQRVQLPVALAATTVNAAAGRLDPWLGAAIGVLVLLGWFAGRRVARRLPGRQLQRWLGIMLIATGLAYL